MQLYQTDEQDFIHESFLKSKGFYEANEAENPISKGSKNVLLFCVRASGLLCLLVC